jgi:plastocyanin
MFVAATLSLGLALAPFAAAAVHDVQVGVPGKLLYDPEAIFAEPGDQVIFHFTPKAHSVTQSSFADPCGPKPGGLDSGLMPVAVNQTDNFPTYTVTVPDKQPMWFYCKQTNPALHCGKGMVFAINCGADGAPNSFTNFKNSALAVGAAQAGGGGGGGGGGYPATGTYTAPYGGVTIPPPPAVSEVVQTITLEGSTWVTTYTSYPGSPAPTPAALVGTTHKIIVGGPGKLLFDPPSINAAPRDQIVFEFHQKNHTVTQSTFADPCRRMTDQAGAPDGFDSGLCVYTL